MLITVITLTIGVMTTMMWMWIMMMLSMMIITDLGNNSVVDKLMIVMKILSKIVLIFA